jgi:hypothetical protein
MIITKLQGGLGNQMFQYAAARGASKDQTVYFDHQALIENNKDTAHFTARGYELFIFNNLKAKQAPSFILRLIKRGLPAHKIFSFLFKIIYVQQLENEYIPFPDVSHLSIVYMNGYFQSEKYFTSIRAQLLKEFSFPPLDPVNQSIKQHIRQCKNAVCLHVRRADYLKSEIIYKVHGVMPLSYYTQALSKLHQQYGILDLFIFSDDIAWCKANLSFTNSKMTFITDNKGNNSWKDMALMTACRHHVIANSSFSWWGAWLSECGGKVFAPDKWFNPQNMKFDIHDLIPPQWQILDVE